MLHPDETHDGGPATEAGFAYRILYVEPDLVRRALDGGALPFVRRPVHDPTPATQAAVMASIQADHVSVPVPKPCRTPTGHAA